jgi:hypothetical protein
MNIFPFLASNAEAVGAPAISWDAPGIIFLKLLAVVFLVLLNGFFDASEFAIVKVRSSTLASRCTSTTTSLQLSKPTAAGSCNFAFSALPKEIRER